MTKISRTSLSIVALTAFVSFAEEKPAPATSTPAPGPASSGPARAVEAFDDALVRGDAATAIALLAPEVLVYESGGQESSRDEYASHHLKEDMAFVARSKREVLSRAEGGDEAHAWVASRSRLTVQGKDKVMVLASTETMVLKNTRDGWRIVHIRWSSGDAQ